MKIIDLFRKKKKVENDPLKIMGKKEKGEFLKADFIDRMIRVEQRVQESFGEKIPLEETSYYKSLNSEEKKRLKKYIKKKELIEKTSLIIVLLSLISMIFLKQEFTGSVIKESLSLNSPAISSLVLVSTVVILLILSLSLLNSKRKKKIFEKSFKIIDVYGEKHKKRIKK